MEDSIGSVPPSIVDESSKLRNIILGKLADGPFARIVLWALRASFRVELVIKLIAVSSDIPRLIDRETVFASDPQGTPVDFSDPQTI